METIEQICDGCEYTSGLSCTKEDCVLRPYIERNVPRRTLIQLAIMKRLMDGANKHDLHYNMEDAFRLFVNVGFAEDFAKLYADEPDESVSHYYDRLLRNQPQLV